MPINFIYTTPSGADATYWVPDVISKMSDGSVSVILNGYVSKETYEQHRSPLDASSHTFQNAPEDGLTEWVEQQIISRPEYAGATIIGA